MDRLGHPVGSVVDGFVLPDSDDQPACCGQPRVGISVAFAIPLDLAWPVPLVCMRGSRSVLWASVPEATVNEHSDLCRTKHDVGRSSQFRKRTGVDSVSEPAGVKQASQLQLGRRIPARLCLHLVANSLRRGEAGAVPLRLTQVTTGVPHPCHTPWLL